MNRKKLITAFCPALMESILCDNNVIAKTLKDIPQEPGFGLIVDEKAMEKYKLN